MKATVVFFGKGDTMPIFRKVPGGTGKGNIMPIRYNVICKKGASPMGGFSPKGGFCIRVYDQQNNFLGILVQQLDAKFGRAKYLLPNTKAVTEEMLHQFPDTWAASIVGHGMLFDIQQAAVVEFVAPWEVIFQELRLQLSNPATHDDAVAEIQAGMSAMRKLGRLLAKESLTAMELMASSEFSGPEKCMLAELLNLGNACIGYNVGSKYANRHISIMQELTALNSNSKNVEGVVKATSMLHELSAFLFNGQTVDAVMKETEQEFFKKLYAKGEVAVTLSVELHADMCKFHIYHGRKRVGTLPQNMFTEQQREQVAKMIIAGQVVTAKASWLSSYAFLVSINPNEQPMPKDTFFMVLGL